MKLWFKGDDNAKTAYALKNFISSPSRRQAMTSVLNASSGRRQARPFIVHPLQRPADREIGGCLDCRK